MPGSSLHLQLAHVTVAARDMDRMVAFYTDVLGFLVTNRGEPVPGMGEMVFISQTASEHHQVVLVTTPEPTTPGFMLAEHMAFRTASLDSIRELADRLVADGNTSAIPISHGNAWSLYFTDPEGHGIEVFIDTPFHVAQPHAKGWDPASTDAEIEATERAAIEGLPEFMPFEQWRAEMTARLSAAQG